MKASVDNKKLILIIVIVLVLAAVGAGFWYWQSKKAAPEKPAAGVKDGLGAQAFNKTNNPLSGELPETNPFEVNTNPFKEQKNPFDKVYKNPFR